MMMWDLTDDDADETIRIRYTYCREVMVPFCSQKRRGKNFRSWMLHIEGRSFAESSSLNLMRRGDDRRRAHIREGKAQNGVWTIPAR
jgi:hypothetical protein